MTPVKYRPSDVDGFKVFYREAGAPHAPKLLLLHGFPSASHMFRDLIPLLADRFHIVAPDLPGFGNSDMPGRGHSFERIAATIDRFTEIVGFDRYAIYVFDYGAPTGFRLAVKHPDRITAIISQNGNAYEEGLSEGWNPIRAYWQDPSAANREALARSSSPRRRSGNTRMASPTRRPSPRTAIRSTISISREPGRRICSSTCSATTRATSRSTRPSRDISGPTSRALLAVWGKNDPFFLPAGAEAFKRDIPDAVVRFLDTGHFALETHAAEIAAAIRDFLPR